MLDNLSKNQRVAYRDMLEQLLDDRGEIELETSGSSMRYMMTDGDRVVVRGYKLPQFRFGDVVLLKERERDNRIYIVHRIINIKWVDGQRFIETKGDSSPKDYFLFDAKTCLGKVIRFCSKGRWYSLEHPIWVVLNPLIARMSRWVSFFSEQAARRGKKKQVLVQRLLHSVIKRLIKLGMALSRENTQTSK